MWGPRLLADGKTIVYASWHKAGAAESRIGLFSLATREKTILPLVGSGPLGVLDGYLVYMGPTGSVLAAPFDMRAGRITGPPVTAVEQATIGTTGAPKTALSQSGSLIYQTTLQANSQMVLSGPDGRSSVVIPEIAGYATPRFSPDGKRIAYTINEGNTGDLWILDRASGTRVRVTTDGKSNNRAEWSPDGKRILYHTFRDGPQSIWWQPVDGSGSAERVVIGPGAGVDEAAISPDGRYVVFGHASLGSDAGIYYRAMTGDTTPKPFVTGNFAAGLMRFSPDGRWLAYATNESGRFEVYVRPFPGQGGRTVVSTDGGSEPVWSRDGRRLFYRRGSQIIAATVSTGSSFEIIGRTPVLDTGPSQSLKHATYDVAPDGRILYLRSGGTPVSMIYVHDWKYELRDRVARAAR